jgi:hypothetical protein
MRMSVPRYVRQHHVGLLALFVALGGASYAAAPFGPSAPTAGTPLIRVSDGTTQTLVVANAFQDVTWDTNRLANDFTHIPGTAAIIANTAGTYWVALRLRWVRNGGAASTGRECVVVNGLAAACESAGLALNAVPVVTPLTALITLNAGDEVKVRIAADSFSTGIEPGPDVFPGNELSIAPATPGPPAAVTVTSFAARSTRAGVELRWRTAQEAGLLGFDVYRERGATSVLLKHGRVLARGATAGHGYSFLDRSAPRTGALGYRLQIVRTDGTRSWAARTTLRR